MPRVLKILRVRVRVRILASDFMRVRLRVFALARVFASHLRVFSYEMAKKFQYSHASTSASIKNFASASASASIRTRYSHPLLAFASTRGITSKSG